MSSIRAVSEPVRVNYQPDQGPGRFRIGLIVLSNDYVTERDFTIMRPHDDVIVITSRVANAPHCTVESLRAMVTRITDSAALLIPEGRLDIIAYSCTSAVAVMGLDSVQSLIQAGRPGVECVTPITSSMAALDRLGAERIAVLTPYIDEVNASIAAYIKANGKTIVAFTSFQIADNEKMACIPPKTLYQAALEADREDADALFISCTAIRAVDVVERIEQKLGKPVVAANQAMFWQALRATGYLAPVVGFGRLLRLEPRGEHEVRKHRKDAP